MLGTARRRAGRRVYQLNLYVDGETARQIEIREWEHVSDFGPAWAYTFDVIDSAIAALTPITLCPPIQPTSAPGADG